VADVALRWDHGRDGFLLDLDRGLFDPSSHEVVHVRAHAEARAFVGTHHYSGTWKGGGQVFELRRRAKLVGVAVYSQPGGPAVLARWFPGHEKEALELSRLVLLDDVLFNAETWFLARTRELLWRLGYLGVISFSDPAPRDLAGGGFVFPGHVGTTYQAASALYVGRTKREAQWLFGDGSVFPLRCRTKIRAYARGAPPAVCQGWEYARDVLLARGAPPFTFAFGDAAAAVWCDVALGYLARARIHPGQHRYLWAKKGAARRDLERHLAATGIRPLPYPEVPPEIVAAKLLLAPRRAPVPARQLTLL
jgi:hypothetical protein